MTALTSALTESRYKSKVSFHILILSHWGAQLGMLGPFPACATREDENDMEKNMEPCANEEAKHKDVSVERCRKWAATRTLGDHNSQTEGGWKMSGGRGSALTCHSCQSPHQGEFPAEIFLHFTRLQDINKPLVMVFAQVLVCAHCGTAQFTVRGTELRSLMDRDVEGAANSQPQTS